MTIHCSYSTPHIQDTLLFWNATTKVKQKHESIALPRHTHPCVGCVHGSPLTHTDHAMGGTDYNFVVSQLNAL